MWMRDEMADEHSHSSLTTLNPDLRAAGKGRQVNDVLDITVVPVISPPPSVVSSCPYLNRKDDSILEALCEVV